MPPDDAHTRARTHVLEIATTLIAREVLSYSLHGNVSVRVHERARIVMTGSSLSGLSADDLAVLDLDAGVIEGHVSPTELEVVRMHTSVYRRRPDVGCVVHTHSPHATAFAVAGRELPVVAESMARWGVARPVPVAAWAPRGSDEAVGNIASVVDADAELPAVLLASHGILVWGSGPTEAVRRTIAIEENAQLALLAQGLGGAQELTPEQAASAAVRRRTFAAGGS
jgi:L-ribulose-5-phosphate 4-epimerase